MNKKPVIIGGGLSGAFISLSLSRAGISHILIGERPGDMPRVGESLNVLGSLALVEYADLLSDALFDKTVVSLHIDGHTYDCPASLDQHWLGHFFARLLGYGAAGSFYHVDRVILDQKLFDLAVQNTLCECMPVRVIDISVENDTITAVHLADGQVIEPHTVFDATNQFAILPKKLGLTAERLSDDKRLVFQHYCSPIMPVFEEWMHETTIIVLKEETDGINAQMWVIPLGKKLSIGITVNADCPLDDAAILELAAAGALRQRGIDYQRAYPQAEMGYGGVFHYFIYERAYGANWMLSGPTFMRLLWTTSSGVSSGYETAVHAPHFVKNPQAAGARYEESLRKSVALHNEHAIRWDVFDGTVHPPEFIILMGEILGIRNLQQTIRASLVSPKWYARWFSRVLKPIFPGRFFYVENFCVMEDGRRLSDLNPNAPRIMS
jgi:flavin-dependent dehydrogenase